MASYFPTDYEALYNDLSKHYLGPDYYPITKGTEQYNLSPKEATTLDEYMYLLVNGHINVTLRKGLDTYWMELLENEWFHKSPLVRWSYATRLFHGTGCRASKKRAIMNLLPLAKEGCPGALCDIGFCHIVSDGLELNYERAICLWIESNRRGYLKAWDKLYREYEMNTYKDLCDELRLFFLYEVYTGFLRSKDATPQDYLQKFDEKESKNLRRIFKEGRKLQKQVSEKTILRLSAELFWSDEDNPYGIDF